jgi:hypothetical protein
MDRGTSMLDTRAIWLMTGPFENILVGREIGSLGVGLLQPAKLWHKNKRPSRQLVERFDTKLAKNSSRPTIILKIGCNPEAAENMIRLTEPSFAIEHPVPGT